MVKVQWLNWSPRLSYTFRSHFYTECLVQAHCTYCGSRCATFLAITRPIFERLCIYNLELSWASCAYCWLKTQAAHRYVLKKTLFGQFLLITRPIFERLWIYNLELLVLPVSLKHEAAHRYVLTKTLFCQFLAISGPILQSHWISILCSNAQKLS